MLLRAGTGDDARAVAEVHAAGWQTGYRDLLPAAYLDALPLTLEERTSGRAGAITGSEEVLLADDFERAVRTLDG